MNKIIPSLAAVVLTAGGFVFATDTTAPPPPPPPPAAPTTADSTSGSAAKHAGAAGQRHPLAGVLKEVEEKGKVTKEEFLAHAKKQAEEMFSKLDKNNDGVIDKSEIAEIEGKMKGLREKMQERGKAGPRKRPEADDKKPTS